MINISVNSNIVSVKENTNLRYWLEQNGYKMDFIAVEIGGEIVKKQDWDSFLLRDGLSIEIVEFVGGG
ncbi:thiamin biosynthesis protein [Campylobacter iguaniorum]|uniref:Thiamin biosynthesis protein n=1 Tax=Campylobacter iguaniorum TaxID=1244531 RepID=A0A076FA47_9BACT|nr:sulfur carrier protein ThiS [Campylobacter iguaniorum]AII14342.1 thiamin biosynthesis protein [Campylobacter iguaniorum]ALV24077.1 thiamin biosynthesis protein [Campylobacter iguaniorum]ANE35508.1 thiamin biosynthesis protein [Campylobacter iguaniorum]